MLFCENCGNSIALNGREAEFTAVYNTSGWETAIVNPEDGSYEEYIEGETTDSDLLEHECGVCGSHDINTGWDGDNVDLARRRFEQHTSGREEMQKRSEERAKRQKLESFANDPSREWDMDMNLEKA